MRRLVAGALVVANLSCAATRPADGPRGDATPHGAPRIDRRVSISSYVTGDGKRHEWLGTIAPAGADSLLFETRKRSSQGLSNPEPAKRQMLARAEVTSIRRTGIVVPIIIVVVACVAGLVALVATGFDRAY